MANNLRYSLGFTLCARYSVIGLTDANKRALGKCSVRNRWVSLSSPKRITRLLFPKILQSTTSLFCGGTLVGCGASGSSGSASSAAKKDYTQILHDARSDEDNKYEMIFTKGEDGKFTAQYGYSAEYEADQLSDEVANMMMPLLGLEDDMYDDFAASVSGMMVSVYGVAIVKPAEGKTQDVVDAMDAYVQSQQKSMEHYLEDQYQIASAARVATVPTGEVVMVCCEDSDTVFENIKKALAA
mgnify:CR=1 FL=1